MATDIAKRRAEEEAAWEAAVAAGEVVLVRCLCARWWVAAIDVGAPCQRCGEPLRPAA